MNAHFLSPALPHEIISDFLGRVAFGILPAEHTKAFVAHVDEAANTLLPDEYLWLGERLQALHFLPAFSSFPIACLLHLAVTSMSFEQTYLNIGVWQGYTFFAGCLSQPEKICLGVDNFSEFGTPKAQFYRDLKRFSGARQHFYEMDYRVYLQTVHTETIGVYLYDAAHTYQDQLAALQLAEPYLAPGALIFIDDANQTEVRQASQAFLQAHPNYVVLADLPTAHNGHPTFWNGLLIVHKRF